MQGDPSQTHFMGSLGKATWGALETGRTDLVGAERGRG